MAAITLVGGINIDIEGNPTGGALIMEDSNPGKVSTAFGGVGRNIVENVARLGGDIAMISLTGDDFMGISAKENLEALGVDVSGVINVEGESTGMYLSILNEKNDMQLAICSMDILERITPDFVKERLDVLNNTEIVAVDCNLMKETLEYITENVQAPLFLDPVSVSKAERVQGIIGKFHTIKPNRIEAELLSGIKITDDESLKRAGQWFMDQGVKRVFISLGAKGAYYKDEHGEGIVACKPVNMKSATGAGDSFSSAILMGHTLGLSAEETAAMGIACASIAVEARTAVNPAMSMDEVKRRMAF